MTILPSGKPPGAEISAKYVNYFAVFGNQLMVRISFAEAFGSPESAVFHTAISLVPADALALAQLLLQTIAQHSKSAEGAK